MKPDYTYVTEAVGEPPEWWDLNGVPHFEPPDVPEELMGRIRCQRCGRVFEVCLATPVYTSDTYWNDNVVRGEEGELQLVEGWAYHDPPFHHHEDGAPCAGNTMCSIPEYEWDEYFDV